MGLVHLNHQQPTAEPLHQGRRLLQKRGSELRVADHREFNAAGALRFWTVDRFVRARYFCFRFRAILHGSGGTFGLKRF